MMSDLKSSDDKEEFIEIQKVPEKQIPENELKVQQTNKETSRTLDVIQANESPVESSRSK